MAEAATVERRTQVSRNGRRSISDVILASETQSYLDKFESRLNKSMGLESTLEISMEFLERLFNPRRIFIGTSNYFDSNEITMYSLETFPDKQRKVWVEKNIPQPVIPDDVRQKLPEEGIEFFFSNGNGMAMDMFCFMNGELVNYIVATAQTENPRKFEKFSLHEISVFRKYAERVCAKMCDQQQIVVDPLTGLFNKEYGRRKLEDECRRAKREQQVLTVLYVDIDDFKGVNDAGHDKGDRILRSVGDAIKKGVRSYDVPIRDGGEEIMVVMPKTNLDVAVRRADQIRMGISQNVSRPDGTPLTVSIGVATYPYVDNAKYLKMHADAAMYGAKHIGKNSVCFSDGYAIYTAADEFVGDAPKELGQVLRIE